MYAPHTTLSLLSVQLATYIATYTGIAESETMFTVGSKKQVISISFNIDNHRQLKPMKVLLIVTVTLKVLLLIEALVDTR